MFLRLALAIALAVSVHATLPQPVAAGCAWYSTSTPPSSIRVLRVKTGRVVTVDFRQYVLVVMSSEWGSYLPYELVKAGAVAVKQYGWRKTRAPRYTQSGVCYHVRDSTSDQLYKPGRHEITEKHRRAATATWGTTVWRSGFISTAYRRGSDVGCARDVDGRRLYAISAKRCAQRGWGYSAILRVYYDAQLR